MRSGKVPWSMNLASGRTTDQWKRRTPTRSIDDGNFSISSSFSTSSPLPEKHSQDLGGRRRGILGNRICLPALPACVASLRPRAIHQAATRSVFSPPAQVSTFCDDLSTNWPESHGSFLGCLFSSFDLPPLFSKGYS